MKVKICCISSQAEASLALRCGADALGLVGPMPSGPGIISNELIAAIAKQVPSNKDTFLLTSETTAADVIAHHAKTNSRTIQLVDHLEPVEYTAIRSALPGIRLVQVIHVLGQESVDEAQVAAQHADALLLDSGNPNLATKELGGTGRTHNWRVSREIVQSCPLPVWLAGGLNPENVESAVAAVQPYGIDICSGVRSNGKLDAEKLKRFFAAIARSDQAN